MQVIGAKVFSFEGFTLDLKRGCLRAGEREIDLRPKSFELLRQLVENAGRLVPKDELIKAVWPDVVVSDESLTRCVSDVRSALGDCKQQIIKTVPRRGYLFAARISLGDADHGTAVSADIATETIDVPRLSIVVLPFTNLGGNKDDEYFADGLTEDLIGDLSQWPDSFVIARSTAFTFKGRAVDVRSIGRDLGVRHVLEGSVRRSGGKVRVGVRLTDARTGGHVWAERFDRDFAALLDLQDEITGRIALALHYTMTELESRRSRDRRSGDPSARELEARGYATLYEPTTKAGSAEAREFFERALKIDERSLRAWAGLAQTHAADLLARWSDDPAAQLRAATDAAAEALKCDPKSPLAHFAAGGVLLAHGKLEAALREYATVIDLGHAWPMAYARMGIINALLGRPGETRGLVEKAIRLSPHDSNLGEWCYYIGIASFMMGQLGEASLWLRRSIEANPGLGSNYSALAAACGLDGRLDEASAALSEYRRLHPGMTVAKLRASPFSGHPAFLAWRERFFDGLRKAGMPEE